MKNLITLFLVIVGTINYSIAQITLDQRLKGAVKNISEGNYFSALSNYSAAEELGEELSAEDWYNYGFAAYKQNAFGKAEMALNKYLELDDTPNRADAVSYLADAQLMQGKYELATDNYNVFLSEYSDIDEVKTSKVKQALSSAEWAKIQNTDNPDVEVTQMGTEVNTGYSEHAPFMIDDQLYFSSLRFEVGKKKKDKTTISKILKNENEITEILPINESFNSDEYLTTNPTFTQDGKIMIYNICAYGENDNVSCKLYGTRMQSDGSFGTGKMLSSQINMPGYTSTQACIKEGKESMTLYYVTDAPGGKGGLDIWTAEFDSLFNFSIPKNSSVNTSFDERTPFYHNASDVLYFSTNGRDGFGGLDIFKKEGTEITNLGSEYNTSYNDLYFYLSEDEGSGFLSSNRKGSLFLDESFEACCYDIYSVTANSMSLDLLALIYDGSTGEELSNSRVILKDLTTGEVIYDSTNPDGNDYTAKIRCDREYELTVYKDGYRDHSQILGPYNDKCGKGKVEEKINIYPSAMELVVNTFDKDGNIALLGTDVELICVSTGEKATKNTGGTNTVTFTMSPDCPKYKLVGNKGGYITAMEEFSTANIGGTITKDLYLGKSAAVVSLEGMIPVQLYFDNDYPNPRTTEITTSKTYSETYNSYYPKKDQFARGYIQQGGSKSDVYNHFDNEVKRGHDNLVAMLDKLIEVLKTGQTINLYIRGYASPLAASDYNISLGRRRVDSVRNQLKSWKGGVLSIYLKNGQLTLTERSFGEDTSPNQVSDDPSNKSKSVYSPEASRERRVEIDEINFNK